MPEQHPLGDWGAFNWLRNIIWSTLGKPLRDAYNWVKDRIVELINFLDDLNNYLEAFIGSIQKSFSGVISDVSAHISSALSNFYKTIVKPIRDFYLLLKPFALKIYRIFSYYYNNLFYVVRTAFDKIKYFFTNLYLKTYDIITHYYYKVRHFFKYLYDYFKYIFDKFRYILKSFLENPFKFLSNFFVKLVQRFVYETLVIIVDYIVRIWD